MKSLIPTAFGMLTLLMACEHTPVEPVSAVESETGQENTVTVISSDGDLDILQPRFVSLRSTGGDSTSIQDHEVALRPKTKFTFYLPAPSEYAVVMHEISGFPVFQISGAAGNETVNLDLELEQRTSGIYIITVFAGQLRASKKIMVVK